VQPFKHRLNRAVAAGRLSAAEAEAKLRRISARLEEAIAKTRQGRAGRRRTAVPNHRYTSTVARVGPCLGVRFPLANQKTWQPEYETRSRWPATTASAGTT
jgi:hypothetical protein